MLASKTAPISSARQAPGADGAPEDIYSGMMHQARGSIDCGHIALAEQPSLFPVWVVLCNSRRARLVMHMLCISWAPC